MSKIKEIVANKLFIKSFLLGLGYLTMMTFLSFQFTHAFFSDTAQSTGNTFAAAAEFPSATPTDDELTDFVLE